MWLLFYFAFLFPLETIVSGELSCFYNYTLYSNYCYRFYSSPLSNYNQALKICENDGADLASIHNAFENSYVWSIANGDVSIGLKYNPDKDIYQWSDDSVLDYTNYDSEFVPMHDYLGYCAKSVKGKWTNAECEDDKLAFACKARAIDVPETPTFACPDPDVFYETPGTLLSPGYPDNFDLNPAQYSDGCYYKLTAKNGYRIRIRVEEFSLKDNIGSVIVYKKLTANEAYEVARIDERFVGGDLHVESNLVLLHLSGSYNGKWKITWSAVQGASLPTPAYGCPEANIIYTKSETIYSPGYPEDFNFSVDAMNAGCYYKIITEKGSYIEIKIDEIFFAKDTGAVDIYKTWKAETANHVLSFKDKNLGQTVKVDSDEVLIRAWNSHSGSYKITWKGFKSEACNGAWPYFNGSCYASEATLMNFNAAESFCSNRNSHLVYIETAEEEQFLTDRFDGSRWLGLTEVENRDWYWMNGERMTYSNWLNGEPDGCCGSAPFCGLFGYYVNGNWGDTSCSNSFSPLCEHEENVLS